MRSQIERRHFLIRSIARGHDDDRCGTLLPQKRHDFQPVTIGQSEVKKDCVRSAVAGLAERFGRRRSLDCCISRAGKHAFEQAADVKVVVDDQNRLSGHTSSPCSDCRTSSRSGK